MDAPPARAAARPILVCHIVFRLDVGGLENGLVNLIDRLPPDRFRHAVLSLKPPTDFRDRIGRPDVPVVGIGKREGKDPAAYRRVWTELRRLRPDVVHTRNIGTIDMLPVARLAGVRRLVHGEHGLDAAEIDGRHRRYNRLRRLCGTLVERHVAVSRDLADWLSAVVGVAPGCVAVIPNGVDVDRFAPRAAAPGALPPGFAPDGAFVVGTVGRLEAVKDQASLARAFVRVLERRPELRRRARLVVVGDGSRRGEIERILAGGGAADLAWLPGWRRDVAPLYRSLDVFALPSRREGISNTLLEAMASGLPVVATAVGGNPEVVEHGVGGLLVPAGDAEALATALLSYADARELRRAHGGAARARAVARFGLAAMVEGYRRVYEGE